MRISKLAAVLVAMVLCVFMASTAMAINVTTRSAEMDDFSPCDRAGTIQYTLTEPDYNDIVAYLAANDYVLIRVALNGLSLPPSPALPVLCQPIYGTVDGTGLGALGGNLPYTNLVALDSIDVDVSDVAGTAAGADMTAYVHGDVGDQFIEIFITAVQAGADFVVEPPWIQVGLYDDLLAVDPLDETHPICAAVVDFSGVSTLTISNEAQPNVLTFSGDNEIGHFLTMTVDQEDCDKGELATCPSTSVITLCDLGGGPQAPGACPMYRKCITLDGDFPSSGDIEINIRTNGATAGANAQEGIYFYGITLLGEDDLPLGPAWTFYNAAGSALATVAPDPCTTWDAEWATVIVDAADVAAAGGDELKFCIMYTANPDEAVPNTDVLFWMTASTLPCGSLYNGTVTGAALAECLPPAVSDSMYFPYVLTQSGNWKTGIVITNLSPTVAAADMSVTFTLTDSAGNVFTYTKSDFTAVVYAIYLDDILSMFSGTPAPGAGWLMINGNFGMDGYEFLTDGNFGAGTLPRI